MICSESDGEFFERMNF